MARTSPPAKPRKPRGMIPNDVEQVWGVLQAKNGNVSQAALHLGVVYNTLKKWIREQADGEDRLAELRKGYDDQILDQAQSALMKNLRSTDGRVSNAATGVAFRYMGKRRGYVPASYIEQDSNEDVTVTVIRGKDEEE